MRLICFDNHVLIWGIKEQAQEEQEDMVAKTKKFINSIDDKETLVLIPSIVLAEFLMLIPAELHAMVINLFNKNFIVAPFDALAASKHALIWQKNKPPDKADKIIIDRTTRAELKADSMIVATAVSRKADCIYSHDKQLKAMAKGFIEVIEIPFIAEAAEMFDKKDNQNWGELKTFRELT